MLGLHYRIGLYTPKAQRTDGYYVLPFLLGDGVAARVDLRADRAAGVLRAEAVHLQAGAPDTVAAELARTLRETAAWLGLPAVAVAPSGDLAGALRAAL